jgi:hypothetical protein
MSWLQTLIVDNFRWQPISSFILNPGTYVVGGEFLGHNNLFPTQAQGVTSLPGYTWIIDLQILGSGLNFPTFSTNNDFYGSNGILLADFSTKAVPEPSSVVLLFTGLAGILAIRLRKKTCQGLHSRTL